MVTIILIFLVSSVGIVIMDFQRSEEGIIIQSVPYVGLSYVDMDLILKILTPSLLFFDLIIDLGLLYC